MLYFVKYVILNTANFLLNYMEDNIKMTKYGMVLMVFVLLWSFVGCSKQEEKEKVGQIEEKKEVMAGKEEVKLPEGHPAIGGGKGTVAEDIGQKQISVEEARKAAVSHPTNGEVKREVRVPDEVKAKWKSVSLKVKDKEKNSEETLSINVGKEMSIKGTNFVIKVKVFLPYYTMYDTYISSKSNEPVNPAVLIELLEGGKSVANGWVFANFTAFNSYKHKRYEIILPPISSK